MQPCPERYDYGPRCSRHDLPAHAVTRLERHFVVPDIAGIPERQAEAEAWFAATVTARRGKGPSFAPVAGTGCRAREGRAMFARPGQGRTAETIGGRRR
jgi:hypothetical protein